MLRTGRYRWMMCLLVTVSLWHWEPETVSAESVPSVAVRSDLADPMVTFGKAESTATEFDLADDRIHERLFYWNVSAHSAQLVTLLAVFAILGGRHLFRRRS